MRREIIVLYSTVQYSWGQRGTKVEVMVLVLILVLLTTTHVHANANANANMDRLPPELLVAICECLVDVRDVLRLRLVS